MICSESGCTTKRTAKGLCQRHYDIMRSKTKERKYTQLLKKCKDTGRITDISEKLLFEITSRPCHYCGCKNLSTGHGLDRINSDGQYLKDNVVSCCGDCNKAKGILEDKRFLDLAIKIYWNTKEKVDIMYYQAYKDD